jgi:pseudaminic acid cytidylyltransferase
MMGLFSNTLVVIPARGGSKRIPNKNLKVIHGQPMIYWPLMAIKNIFNADKVIVSTDSESIKKSVECKGLNVPFIRPKSLSGDFTGTVPVVTHALKWYEENVQKIDYVLTIYPTAVMLRGDDIREAIKTLKNDKKCDSIMSAIRFPFPIQRAVYENNDGYAQMFEPENYSKRSQDLTEAMHDAGQFYLSNADAVRGGALITNSNVRLHLLHRNDVVDIDTIEDFEIAEEKLKLYKDIDIGDWKF